MNKELPRFEVFSETYIHKVLDYVLSQSRLQRNGLPSYQELIASNTTFDPPMPSLSKAQQKDYETLRSNLASLIDNYLTEHPEKKPVAAIPSPFMNPKATKEDYDRYMADLEHRLKSSSKNPYESSSNSNKLVEYLRTYVLNSNIVASRKRKPDFIC